MKKQYIDAKKRVKFNADVDSTGVKKNVLAGLIGITPTYLGLLLSGDKKLCVNKMVSIDYILEKYIALHQDLSTNKARVTNRNRVGDKYEEVLLILDNLTDYSELAMVTVDFEDDYLSDKLNKALAFGLDSNMSLSMIGDSLKTLIYCYG